MFIAHVRKSAKRLSEPELQVMRGYSYVLLPQKVDDQKKVWGVFALVPGLVVVFGLLRGKRWICCTTHFVQRHCSVEDLAFAYDLIYRLARE